MKKITIILFLLLFICGCATRPNKVQPGYISKVFYANLSCNELITERTKILCALKSICKKQEHKRARWALGIFLLAPSIGAIGADYSQEISRLKGEFYTIQKISREKNCLLPEINDKYLLKVLNL